MELWCEALLSGHGLSYEAREIFADYGRRRAHQGVPLQSLMRAFSIGQREIWQGYLELAGDSTELGRELLFNVSRYMFCYFDQAAEETVQAYLDEQLRKARWREYLDQRLHYILLHRPEDEVGFREVLAALGLDPGMPRAAMALDVAIDADKLRTREDEVERLLLQVARAFKLTTADLVRTWHRERLLVWLPCAHGEAISQADQRLARGAAALLAGLAELREVGLGIMNRGARGWTRSAEEALRALDFFSGESAERVVRRYSDILVEDSIRGSENALRYLVSLLEQLSNEPDLLLTLDTYLGLGRRRAQAAKRLGIHPNTLDYRLGRIEELLGASLADVDWVGRLDIALRLRRYSLERSGKSDQGH
ncbi:CdaR family transcriptional regulator [Pseudomonas sp. 17104299]|uniref:PucR family transcriptional regulator n=1 Tax=Pseudomonas sp. 17104299 TaxID=2952239 RepID=UPI0021584A57|nr:helix-turn-helix domain-containing protein [Pseudomonas sp. 17104299]